MIGVHGRVNGFRIVDEQGDVVYIEYSVVCKIQLKQRYNYEHNSIKNAKNGLTKSTDDVCCPEASSRWDHRHSPCLQDEGGAYKRPSSRTTSHIHQPCEPCPSTATSSHRQQLAPHIELQARQARRSRKRRDQCAFSSRLECACSCGGEGQADGGSFGRGHSRDIGSRLA